MFAYRCADVLPDVGTGAEDGCVRMSLTHYNTPEECERCIAAIESLAGELRGCIGSLEADSPLVVDVARSAFRAAYEDPRFSPLAAEERQRLEIHISVLSRSEPMILASEADLCARLRPGIDGLVLGEGSLRATFLPDVWESLPEPSEFVARLKEKAGLAAGHWSPDMQVSRYTTRSIS